MYIIDNNGKELYKYIKTRLVPLFEDKEYVAGDGDVPNLTVTLPSGKRIKLAILILLLVLLSPKLKKRNSSCEI